MIFDGSISLTMFSQDFSGVLKNNSKTIVQISDSVKTTAGYFNINLRIEMLQQVKDMTCEYYFLKLSMNQ